jgi:hypothetical protein
MKAPGQRDIDKGIPIGSPVRGTKIGTTISTVATFAFAVVRGGSTMGRLSHRPRRKQG